MRDQQVASFVGSIAVLNKNKGGDVGNHSKHGNCGSAPTRKTSELPGLPGSLFPLPGGEVLFHYLFK